MPYPTYTVYRTMAELHEVECINVPTRKDFTIDVDLLLSQSAAKAIILVNPNAPTGILLPLPQIEQILQHFSGLVIVDEAYMDFAEPNHSAIRLVKDYPNLVVLRTMSKSYSLCGAQFGYAFAQKHLIETMDKCKESYNVNMMTQAIAAAALADQAYLDETVRLIKKTRTVLTNRLLELNFEVFESQTNFVLCRPPQQLDAKSIYEYFADHQVYVRYFEEDRLADKLRITIGTEEETAELLRLLGQYITMTP